MKDVRFVCLLLLAGCFGPGLEPRMVYLFDPEDPLAASHVSNFVHRGRTWEFEFDIASDSLRWMVRNTGPAPITLRWADVQWIGSDGAPQPVTSTGTPDVTIEPGGVAYGKLTTQPFFLPVFKRDGPSPLLKEVALVVPFTTGENRDVLRFRYRVSEVLEVE